MDPGGAEVRLTELVGRLPPGEFEVDVCALSGMPGALDDHIRECGGEVIPLRLDAGFSVRFLRLLRRRRYDVVHSHVMHASGPMLALALLAGVRVRIAHLHGTSDGHRSTPARRMQRAVKRVLIEWCATDIIACGEGAMRAVWRADWTSDPRCQVVYDALDPDRFSAPVDRNLVRRELGVPRGALVFLHIGNHLEPKNHPRLISIFAAIRRAEAEAWLVLVGAGTDEPHGPIAAAIAAHGLGDRVLALGRRSDVPRLLKTADALLLPSLHEGLPGVVLEACVSGVPVLASDLPGVREIASRLPGVEWLSLDAPDTEWAAAAIALSRVAVRLALRERALDAFRPTVFHVDAAVAAHRALWRRRVEASTA
ncbi:MAG: glycosyltransferase [Candidatus Limnocylindrales bacterium]|nr:glycosyltransferase [Candidatus Limnocylindrales bacterium]